MSSRSFKINAKDAKRHKIFLHGTKSAAYQIFPEKGTVGRAEPIRGTWQNVESKIASAVMSQRAIGIAINKFAGDIRKTSEVKSVRAFMADFDGTRTLAEIKRLPVPPQLVIRTSPGHFQAAWRRFASGVW